MKLFYKKLILTTVMLPIIATITNICIGGQIANAATPSISLNDDEYLTQDMKIVDIIDEVAYLTEDGNYYVASPNYIEDFARIGADYQKIPKKVNLADGETIKEAKVGEDYGYIITNKGNLYMCGLNANGEMGNLGKYTAEFTKISSLSNVTKCITDGNSTFVYCTGKGWYASGKNDLYHLGFASDSYISSFSLLSNSQNIDVIDATYGLFIDSDKSLKYFYGEARNPVYQAKLVNSNYPDYDESKPVTGVKYVTRLRDVISNNEWITAGPRLAIVTDKYTGYICYSDDYHNKKSVPSRPVLINRVEKTDSPVKDWDCRRSVFSVCLEYFLYEDGTLIVNSLEKDSGEKIATYTSEGKRKGAVLESSYIVVSWDDDLLYLRFGTNSEKMVRHDNSDMQIKEQFNSFDAIYNIYGFQDDAVKVVTISDNSVSMSSNYTANSFPYKVKKIFNNEVLLGIDDRLYYEQTTPIEVENNAKIEKYEKGHYWDYDGNPYKLYGTKLERVGIKSGWPKEEQLVINNASSSATIRYAFSQSETYEGIKAEEWKSYNKETKKIKLDPPTSGIYYLYVEIAQDGQVYVIKWPKPFVVNLDNSLSSTGNDYAYISADMRIPDRMAATFNIVFTPPSDIFLSNSLSTQPNKLFMEMINNGLLELKVYDSSGNDITNKIGFAYVTDIYKNGVHVPSATENYLFTKREADAVNDNLYILRLNIGGSELFTGVGKQYKVEFNAMKGYDSVTMQNFIPINTHKFTLNVYVTELPNLT